MEINYLCAYVYELPMHIIVYDILVMVFSCIGLINMTHTFILIYKHTISMQTVLTFQWVSKKIFSEKFNLFLKIVRLAVKREGAHTKCTYIEYNVFFFFFNKLVLNANDVNGNASIKPQGYDHAYINAYLQPSSSFF